MAIESTITLSGTATQSDRTARVEIMCPFGGDYVIGVQREVVTVQNNEIIRRVAGKRIVKKLSQVASTPVTIHGATLTVGQIAAFIAKACDDMAASETANG